MLYLVPAKQTKVAGRLAAGRGDGPNEEVFVSPDGTTSLFVSGTTELRLIGNVGLPVRGVHCTGRRGLLFSSVGNQCLPVVQGHWLADPAIADFDVALLHYGEEAGEVYEALQNLAREHPFIEVGRRKDFKWPNFRQWIEAKGGNATVAARYDYVWVVDDDMRLSTAGINKLFSTLREHENIQFACPSFDQGSEGVWRYFDTHDPAFHLRYTDFVECAAVVLKTSMLLDSVFKRCLQAARTGCFLDFCFHPISGGRVDAVAIIDEVQCHHPFRDESLPSELRAILPWEDHKQDAEFFEKANLPKDWWWYRRPVVFSGLPSQSAPPRTAESLCPSTSSRSSSESPLASGFPGPTSAEDALEMLSELAGQEDPAFATPSACPTKQLTFPPRVRKTWHILLSA